MDSPVPLTDLAGSTPVVRRWLPTLVPSLGRPDAQLEFWKDFTGCWRIRARVGQGSVEFTLLRTPAGGVLAWPTPMPSQFETGVPASDGSRWRQYPDGTLRAVGAR